MKISQHRRRALPVAIERDVHHSLRAYALRTGRPTTDVVAEAVAQYIDRNDSVSSSPGCSLVPGRHD